jgi:phenylacetate-CoA ligase
MDARVTEFDADRYPDLSTHGRAMLAFLQEHPHAPVFRNQSGHRLPAHDLEMVRAAEQEVLQAEVDWQINRPPAWALAFARDCIQRVPAYRRVGALPQHFHSLPTFSRADLGRDVASFVPDDVEPEELINFRTSGTTGHPLLIASHPRVAAQYLGYHKRALRRFGVELKHGRGQVGVVLIGHQSKCFTYVSVTPSMDESGLVKLNLHPDDWRSLEDRKFYLEALQAEVIAGDPISFSILLEIAPRLRPAALLSTSMELLPALREQLATRFDCPVLDLYSMNEAGPLAVFDPAAGGHALLQHRMYVEILDDEGTALPAGERGEIVLTGGFNFCMPLLRYCTGDHASLERRGDDLVLMGLSGRPPVRYRTAAGVWLNNIEITHALRPWPLTQFSVHQDESGRIQVRYVGPLIDVAQVREALVSLLGADTPLDVQRVPEFAGKIIQYTSALAEPRS